MPPKAPTPGLKTIYLDWNVFQDAIEDQDGAVELFGFIQDASSRANLCFSLFHVFELLNWGDKEKRIQQAHWLESLDLVWMKPMEVIQYEEIKRVLLKEWSQNRLVDESPFAPSFLSVFKHWGKNLENLKALSNALRDPTITNLVKEIGSSNAGLEQVGKLRKFSVESNLRLRVDRKMALNEYNENEIRRVLKQKLDESLIEEAVQVNSYLAQNGDPFYGLEENGIFRPPNADEVRSKFPRLNEAMGQMPYIFLQSEVIRNASFLLPKQNPQSKRFQRHQSDVHDWVHLVGAAYCDVFTCDRRVDYQIGNAREMLGKARQISRGEIGGIQELLSELRRQAGL